MEWEGKKEAVRKLKICIRCKHFDPESKQCMLNNNYMPQKVIVPKTTCPTNKW